MSLPSISCSVVVPVFNSEQSLPLLAARLASVLPTLSSDYELLLINDGSTDRSWDVICRLAWSTKWIRGINLMRNYGQHNALLCGIREAQHEIIITIDDDLQHPPEEIHRLLEALADGFDVVYGTPQGEQHSLLRTLASRITKLVLQSSMGAKTASKVSAFRAFRATVCKAFAAYQGPFVSIDVLLTWGTTRFAAVRVKHEPRPYGTSNYTFRKLIVHAFNMMTGFSVWPLQAASTLGFGFLVFGMFVFVYVIGRYLIEGGSVPGFPFLAAIIAIFSGAQLFALGVIGEYLARMHFRLMDRPAYTIRERAHSEEFNSSGK